MFRSVVSSLTEEGPNDLAEELIKGEAVRINDSTLSDEENENWETWVPSPIEIEPSKLTTQSRKVLLIYKMKLQINSTVFDVHLILYPCL